MHDCCSSLCCVQTQHVAKKQTWEKPEDRGVSLVALERTLRKILTALLNLIAPLVDKDIEMGKRPGLKYAALQQLDSLMAPGVKRSEAKAAARARGESTFAFTDGVIHAYETRTNYQKIVMRFAQWCREEYAIRSMECLQERADELASLYLTQRIAAGYSAWTLQTERSALRMFFENRLLASEVELPKRRRENITRSRLPAVRDKHFQPKNWEHLVKFVQACGLRREELRDLRVGDICFTHDGQLVVCVRNGKGGKARDVPVFPGREQDVLAVTAGRADDEHVFSCLPSAMDIHDYRRRFAQELYEYHAQRPLPPAHGRLSTEDIDRAACEQVTRALGHNRLDVIYTNYIR